MFIFKVLGAITKFGGKIVDAFDSVVDFADHLIHKKEYERRARKRRIFWTVFCSVIGGIIVVLMFPYKLVIKRNGDFEVRTLLLRVYRKTEEPEVIDDGDDGFDIAPAADAVDAIEE